MNEQYRHLIGQRMLVGFPGTTIPDELREAVQKYKIGNFILFAHNIVDRAQARDLCAELQQLALEATGKPALIAADQEGGIVNRLPKDCAIVPTALAVSATNNPGNAYVAGKITGTELRALGINFDLAPVLDINSNPLNPVIGARSYGDTPEKVCEYALPMIHGLNDAGVFSCAKHFPGHGDTAVDSHLGLPRVDKSLEELEQCELVPFREAVRAGVSAVMSTHILFPQLDDSGVPATMSRTIITGLLREKLGFDGLVCSDCMMMQAIATFYGTVNGCVAACKAGVDLLCISHDPVLAGEICEALYQALETGDLNLEECVQSVGRIQKLKGALEHMPVPAFELAGCEAFHKTIEDMRAAGVTRMGAAVPALGEKPFFTGCCPFQPTLVSSPVNDSLRFCDWMQQQFGGTSLLTSIDPDDDEIANVLQAAADATCIVLDTYNGHIKRGQMKLLSALAALGKPMVVAALRNPYDLTDLPEGVCGLLAYEYNTHSLCNIARVLKGDLVPTGKLALKL